MGLRHAQRNDSSTYLLQGRSGTQAAPVAAGSARPDLTLSGSMPSTASQCRSQSNVSVALQHDVAG